VLPQDPTVCLAVKRPQTKNNSLLRTHRPPTTGAGTDIPTAQFPHRSGHGGNEMVLLRKEVIQPHLPVRLPCYDFVPIADPTFDSSPHKG
jgi:hypothetical protein